MPRQGHGHHGRQRPGGHRRQVAEVHRQGLAAHPARIDLGQLEIDAVGEQIDRDDALVDAGHPQHGRIVARPQPQQRMRRQAFAKPGDEFAFHRVSRPLDRLGGTSLSLRRACVTTRPRPSQAQGRANLRVMPIRRIAMVRYGCRATFKLTGMKP